VGYGGSAVVKVWVVQEDEYDAQGIIEIFLDEDEAKSFTADHNGQSPRPPYDVDWVCYDWEVRP
jgi:hypothetical protein